jgi:hypothetical protein
MYLVNATPPKQLIGFLEELHLQGKQPPFFGCLKMAAELMAA